MNPTPNLIAALDSLQSARAMASHAGQSANEAELDELALIDEAAAKSEAIIIGALARVSERRRKERESAI